MKRRRFSGATRGACIGFAFALLSVSAATADETFQFDYVFSSSGSPSSPTGPSPWLSATIQDVTPGTVKLTINTSGLQGSEFISDFYLNLDPNINPTSLSFGPAVQTGSFATPMINLQENKFKADGDGYYDIDLNFATANGSTFTVGDSLSYQISDSGLKASSFEFTSAPGGGAGTYLAAAHVQSIGPDGSASAWIAPAPEPATWALLGCGAGLLVMAKRKFNGKLG